MDANTAVENVQAVLPVAPVVQRGRGRPAKVAAAVAAKVDAAPTATPKKARKAANPVARVHRAIMREYLDRAAQAMLYGQPAAADAWYAEAKARRAILDKAL
jgi:hypothetical protein